MSNNPVGQVSAVIRDIKPDLAELDAIVARTDRATLAAVKASQTVAKASVKSGMRGRPRWDKRGAIGSGKSEPAVNLHLTPHHVARGGGPGQLTGILRKSVGGMKRPKKTGRDSYTGGVGVGGRKSVTNIYRFHTEARYPFMRPGVKKAEKKMAVVWERAWSKAVHK